MIPNSKALSPRTLINLADAFRSVIQASESSDGYSSPNLRVDPKQLSEVIAASNFEYAILSHRFWRRLTKM